MFRVWQRGCLQLLWECGGTLAAPAISDKVIHKTMAFIAPKLIGGEEAPTPLNDLGFVEMTQVGRPPRGNQAPTDNLGEAYLTDILLISIHTSGLVSHR